VDAWQDGEAKYLRVIDYKTRGKAVNLWAVYYGLQLQLVLYLAAAVASGRKSPRASFTSPSMFR
jgi:ATP-dependent helicase/nuclease subunit B